MEDGVLVDLPSADERERLLDGLARLVRQRGYAQLIGHPVLLPETQYFPDRWQEGPEGVVVLLRRLLHYAGLGDFRVHLSVYENHEHAQYDTHGVGHGAGGAAAWFAGIEGDVCRFGVERRELRDVDDLVGTLGHEVAHAYRDHHALIVSDSRVEEQLTDLTAVYLGFGVFLLNSSSTFKTGGYSASGERLLWEKRTRGYLSPPQIALLLGAQSMLRGSTRKERAAIASALAPNHRKLYQDACEHFEGEADALRGRLQIPDPSEWPVWPKLDELVASLSANDDDGADEIVDVNPTPAAALRDPAARVTVHRGSLFAVAGGGLPFLLASVGVIEGTALLASSVVGAALGWGLGRALRTVRCSSCKARLIGADSACPTCGAPLREAAAPESIPEADDDDSYDFHTDDSVPERERAEARLLSAMFLGWAIERGLISSHFRRDHAELVESVLAGRPDSHQLYAAWIADREPFDERGARFAAHYLDADGHWPDADYAALMTAELRDSPATYRRFALLLDRRFDVFEGGSAD